MFNPHKVKVPAINVISNVLQYASMGFTLSELQRQNPVVWSAILLHMCPQQLVFPAAAPRYAGADSRSGHSNRFEVSLGNEQGLVVLACRIIQINCKWKTVGKMLDATLA